MTFTQIQNTGATQGTAAVAALLETARADVPVLEAAHQAAQAAQARAEAERARVARLLGRTQAEAAALFAKQKAAKLRALESAANETADEPAWKAYREARDERVRVVGVLSYLGSFPAEDTTRQCLVAEMAEREAYADYLESTAVMMRLRLQLLSAEALAADPGATISLMDHDDPERGPASTSTRIAREVTRIRNTDAPAIQLALRDHDRRVAASRKDIDHSLWS